VEVCPLALKETGLVTNEDAITLLLIRSEDEDAKFLHSYLPIVFGKLILNGQLKESADKGRSPVSGHTFQTKWGGDKRKTSGLASY